VETRRASLEDSHGDKVLLSLTVVHTSGDEIVRPFDFSEPIAVKLSCFATKYSAHTDGLAAQGILHDDAGTAALDLKPSHLSEYRSTAELF
jgi:hypothetical protein